MKQRTIKNTISFIGTTLHTGEKSLISFHPAKENSGICFLRKGVLIPALATNVTETRLATTLTQDGQSVQTIEHLMCAISLLFIDNLIIEVSTQEIPIVDGSALPFIMLLQEAGIIEQNESKKFIRINRSVIIHDGEKCVRFSPANCILYNVEIKFNHPEIDKNPKAFFNHSEHSIRDIAGARTFGFMRDLEYLQKNNLALGANINNAIVLDDHKYLNDEPLRYSDEFVRHKILDAIGDLRLMGHNFIGEFSGYKCGHDINNKLARAIIDQKAFYLIETEEKDNFINNLYKSQTLAEVL